MKDFYREELLEIYRNPVNRGSIANPTVQAEEINPMCGDEVTVQLKIEGDKIQDIKYGGEACAVSIISSSLLSEYLVDKSLEEAKNFTKEDLLELIDVNLTTSRVKCATLFLDALHKAISLHEKARKQEN